MPFDEYGMSGEGTLEEYFTHKPFDMADDGQSPTIDPSFEKEINDRDSAIDRLCLELFADKSGLQRSDVIKVTWPESSRELRNAKRRKGLQLVGIQPDDPILMLFKDGEPIAAFYASYRGVYQAGGYVVSTGESFGANNFVNEGTERTNDQWYVGGGICSQIAEEAALGQRRNYFY